MFERIIGVEALHLPAVWENKLKSYAKQTRFYSDKPHSNAEIIRRIGDADAVMVSHTTPIDKDVLIACPNIRYIGMCCSLYLSESANVDIPAAKERGIVVKGVRDYGDEGVAEYIISELVRLLHGFGSTRWKDQPQELTGIQVGVLGMGTTGQIAAKALRFFGTDILYYSRTEKPELEERFGYRYLPLQELLVQAEIIVTCLTKNTVLLGCKELEMFGSGKILMNISIGASFDSSAIKNWLAMPGNYLLGDSLLALGNEGGLLALDNVICPEQSAGMTTLAKERLGRKVIDNIEAYCANDKVVSSAG